MDKKRKRNRQKVPGRDELMDMTTRGVSFDTSEGRAAQGMTPEIGQGSQDPQGGHSVPPAAPKPPSVQRD